ncbi:MAG: FlgD immunoglobulin-like domain containing protein [Candidatus Zixiibacteriota bacterium]
MRRSLVSLLVGLKPLVGLILLNTAVAEKPEFLTKADILQALDSRIKTFGVGGLSNGAIPWPTFYGVHQTEEINASFDCLGSFGPVGWGYPYEDYGWPTASFETPPYSGSTYIWGGAFWIGGVVGGDTLVSVGMNSWAVSSGGEEFRPTEDRPSRRSPTVTAIRSPAPYSLRASFDDTIHAGFYYRLDDYSGLPHRPLNIEVVLKSYSWPNGPGAGSIIYDATISNIGAQPIEKGYAGVFLDAEVKGAGVPWNEGYDDDMAGSVQCKGIGYVVDNDGDPRDGVYVPDSCPTRIIALRFLESSFTPTDSGFNWWRPGFNSQYNVGPRRRDRLCDYHSGGTGTLLGDAAIYCMLSSGEWDYDQSRFGTLESLDTIWLQPDPVVAEETRYGCDTRFVMSLGPFDLMPDSSVRIMFTTFTADNVHTDPYILDYITYIPEYYSLALNLSGVFRNAAIADSLAEVLRTELPPVSGLRVVPFGNDSAILIWDPWVFDNVNGIDLYLTVIPLDSFPYPGVPPPWYRPDSLPLWQTAVTGRRVALGSLDRSAAYSVRAAYNGINGVGPVSGAVAFRMAERSPAPVVAAEHAFHYTDEGITVNWYRDPTLTSDHYHVYKFADAAAAAVRYFPFYAIKGQYYPMAPVDSFAADDTLYYYYALPVLAELPATDSSFHDPDGIDGCMYAVTAVDTFGYESDFSTLVAAHRVDPKVKDILVLTNSGGTSNFVLFDTVRQFYNGLLSGYDFDIYNYAESTSYQHCPDYSPLCMDWHDLMPYRLIIVDDGLLDRVMYASYENATHAFTMYLQSGGTMAYFGSFSAMFAVALNANSATKSYPLNHDLIRRFFGVDSVFYVGVGHYFFTGTVPIADTAFGFRTAQSADGQLPSISFDTARQPFTSNLSLFWPEGSPPSVSTFSVNDAGTISHRYLSGYPLTSMSENKAVGVRTESLFGAAYLFGFHLWYMVPEQARELIDYIMQRIPTDINAPPEELPASMHLEQNYPNPFNATTSIRFELGKTDDVSLELFNILGQRIRVLCHERRPAGSHQIEWDGLTDQGTPAASGVYLYRLKSGDRAIARKMLLLK